MSWPEHIIWATYGFALGATGLILVILFSTILGPPRKGAPRIDQVRVFVLRFLIWVLVLPALMIERPLFVGGQQPHTSSALVFVSVLILTLVFGLYKVLPKFVTIKTMTES